MTHLTDRDTISACFPRNVTHVGKQTIVHGSCLKQIKRLPDASVDVIITSPPYNIGIAYRSYDDTMPRKEYLKWLSRLSKQLSRVLKEDGSFFLNVGSTSSDPWIALEVASSFRNDFILQNNIIWTKSISIDEQSFGHFKPINSARYLNNNYENIFHFSKTGKTIIDRLAVGVPFKDKTNISRWGHTLDKRCAGNVWHIPYKTVSSKTQKFNHPASFPEELPMRCMKLHGGEDLVVLDPFLGSGTTLVAAEKLGHHGIGFEIDDSYVETSVARVEGHLEDEKAATYSSKNSTVFKRNQHSAEDIREGCIR
ncbi:MAG: site-specific DNA-methyltransferase [Acetobacter fabarum]|jgi:site-specific DNA-methyltransferase (adenine-specific)|uniref:DNA-methyltransferase n=1 Tax=Acetobacter fabarum TaxID=483199 RepID=UPI00242BF086|nr:site-specific DNA-methyltransferase [Acetobacter fabarum]MCH4025611.1 site-specific DNA-methyltransferase [Acetobacter fabarum]MCH4054737.1 site-specific DNA-methyltransferase [Acetobacter fabarum]MCH4086530.1 site-specific DNA-methyltransferase [Acetobacter fabarum]MCH4138405.1 site-specific DNA-methyltransferase [Acetobacter fabarum]MCI1322076.1 site-specific DNA-methyltransferase [Acetobacter fabarum]